MIAADECHDLGAGRFFWQVYEPAVKTDLTCTAFHAGRLPVRAEASPSSPTAGRVGT